MRQHGLTLHVAGTALAVWGAVGAVRAGESEAAELTPDQWVTVEEHLDLVDAVAWVQKRRSGLELEDLVSAGRMGLIEAVQRYDESRGVPFPAYARHRILGFMLDSERKEYSAQSALDGAGGLDESLHASDGVEPDEAAVVSERIETLARLDSRTRHVLRERLRGRSLRAIGEELGLSEGRISQIARRARDHVLEGTVPEESGDPLTPAQLETLKGAALGETASETAGRLGKSVWTVRTQKTEALRRLGAWSTTHAVVRALHSGILSLDEVTERWARANPQM